MTRHDIYITQDDFSDMTRPDMTLNGMKEPCVTLNLTS